MKTALLILFLSFSGIILVNAQVPSSDSLKIVLKESNDPEVKIDVLTKLSKLMRFSDNDSSQLLLRQALQLTEQLSDTSKFLELSADMGQEKFRLNEVDSAAFYFDRAIRYTESKLFRTLSRIYYTYGDIYEISKEYDQAIEFYQKAEYVALALNDSSMLPDVYYRMGQLWYGRSNKPLMLDYFTQTIELSRKFSSTMYRYIYLVGTVNALIRVFPESVWGEYLGELLVIHNQFYPNLSDTPAFSHANLPFILGFITQSGSEYEPNLELLKKYAGAVKRFSQDREYALSLYNIGIYEPRTDSALMYLNKALEISSENDFGLIKAYSLKALSGIYEKKQMPGQALLYFKKYHAVSDTLGIINENEKVTELREEFEAEKRELEISSLEQQNVLERAISKQRANQRNWLITGILLLLVLAAFIIYFFRQRLKNTQLNASIAQAKVNEMEQQQQILTMNSMIEGQENERRRIAQDLHDGLGGLLTTIKMHFSNIQNEISKLDELKALEKTGSLIEYANSEVRKIAHEMMPGSLVKLGLTEALSELSERNSIKGTLDIHFEALNMNQRLNETSEIMLFRAAQEMVNNIQKHANATEVIIQLSDNGTDIELLVEDNGDGFDPDKTEGNFSLGLKSIDSRAKFLNGDMIIESKPGTGTTITLSIPKKGNIVE